MRQREAWKDPLEIFILTHIAKDLSEVKVQNKDLAAELDLKKQSMSYLSGQNKDLRDQLHQASFVNSKLHDFLRLLHNLLMVMVLLYMKNKRSVLEWTICMIPVG